MAYTGIADVEVDYGPIDGDMVSRAQALIDRAEAMIGQRVPDLDARIAAGRTSTPLVRQVVGELVAAKLRNPDGYMQQSRSRTVGPFSETVSGTIAGGVAGGGGGTFTLTRRHMAMLGVPRGAQTMALNDTSLRRPTRRPVAVDPGAGSPEGVPFGYLWPPA